MKAAWYRYEVVVAVTSNGIRMHYEEASSRLRALTYQGFPKHGTCGAILPGAGYWTQQQRPAEVTSFWSNFYAGSANRFESVRKCAFSLECVTTCLFSLQSGLAELKGIDPWTSRMPIVAPLTGFLAAMTR